MKPDLGVMIHPVTGAERVTYHPPAVIQAKPSNTMLPAQITQAQVQSHSMGLLMSPVTPDRAKSVLATAIDGDLYSQWELFSIMEDSWDRLTKNLNEVKNAVKRLSWNVEPYTERGEPASKSAQAKADLVQAAIRNWQPEVGSLEYGFEDCLYNAMDAMGKGLAVQEVHWHIRDGAIVPRAGHMLTPRQYAWNGRGTHIGLIEQPQGGSVFERRGGTAWQPFPRNKFLVSAWNARSGAPGATALLRPLVPYFIGFTYGWRWLMQTAQLFGIPFRWATYDDDAVLPKLAAMLENLGSAGWAAFPRGTALEFKEAVTSARDNPQAMILELAKKACDLLILGQELSSESEAAGLGSGNAMLQGKVRQDVLHHAAWWAADHLNYQLVPAILELNYGDTSEAPVICPDLSVDPDPKALAERDTLLVNMGLKISEAYLYNRHSIPAPEKGEAVVERAAVPSPSPFGGMFGSGDMDARRAGCNCHVHAKSNRATDQLIDNVLEDLTGVQARWLGGVKPFFADLIQAAQNDRVSDAEFLQTIERAQAEMPELFSRLDKGALADALEAAMGAACVNGALQGHMERRRKL